MEGFETILDGLSIEKGRFTGYLQKQFASRVTKAVQDEHAGTRKDLDAFSTVIAKAVGLPAKPKGKDARRVLKMLKGWSERSGSHGIVWKEQGRVAQHPLSQWEAISMWMQWQDKSLASTFEGMEINDATMLQVEAFIGPEGVAAAKAMLKWYEEAGPRMQSKVEQVDGYRPALVENYSPIRRRMNDRDEFSDLATGEQFARATEKNGSMKSRIETKSELRFQPANSVFVEHVGHMNHYLAFAEVAKDLRATFDSDMVKTAVRQASGSNRTYGILSKLIDDTLRGSIDRHLVNRTMDMFIRNIAVAKLAFNATSAVKQLASVPAYMDGIPTKDFLAGLADFWKSPVENSKILIGTQYIQNRIRKSYDRDLAQVANKATNLAILDVRNVRDKMMFLTRYGDLGAILQGGWSVYRHTYNQGIKSGMSHVEATIEAERVFSETTDRAQQSAEVSSMSDWQRSGSFAKMFTMFMTSPIQYHRLTWGAVRAAAKGRISKAQAAKTVMIYHVMLPQIFFAMGSAFIGLWSDDEDIQERFWQRQLAALLYGNLNAIYLFGDALEAVSNGISDPDAPTFLKEVSIPIIEEINSIVGGSIQLANAEDDEDMMKGADKLASGLLSLSGVPYDPVKKQLEGILDAVSGETEQPLLRFLGFSEYALLQDKD